MQIISEKFNIYTSNIKNTTVMSNNFSSIALKSILGFFGLFAVCYIFILGNMVVNIIARKGFDINSRSLSSEVNDLELKYLALSNSLDIPFSYSLGFKEVKTTFAVRKTFGFRTSSDIQVVQNDL